MRLLFIRDLSPLPLLLAKRTANSLLLASSMLRDVSVEQKFLPSPEDPETLRQLFLFGNAIIDLQGHSWPYIKAR